MRVSFAGINFNTNLRDNNGTFWYITNMEGWDTPDTHQGEISSSEFNGSIPTRGTYGPRTLTIEGVVKAESEERFWEAWYALTNMASDLNVDQPFTVYEKGAIKTLFVRRSGPMRMSFNGVNAFVFSLGLRAFDPMKYGLVEVFSIRKGGVTVQVLNKGKQSTAPTFQGCYNIVDIRNVTTGLEFQAGTAQSPLTLPSTANFKARSLIDKNGGNRYRLIRPTSSWWTLAPGVTTVKNFGSSDVSIHFRPAWL